MYLAHRIDASDDDSLSLMMRFDMIDQYLGDELHQDKGILQIATEQVQVLKSFYDVNPNDTGKYMEILWDMFKPRMPNNSQKFEYFLELENLAEKFDHLRQSSFIDPKVVIPVVKAFHGALFTLQQGNTTVHPDELINDISNILRDFGSMEGDDQEPARAIFQPEFRKLYSIFCLYATVHSTIPKELEECLDRVSILAGRKSKSLFSLSSSNKTIPQFEVLACIATYAFELMDATSSDNESHVPFVRSLMDRLAGASKIQLRDLNQFKAELLLMGNVLATGAASQVDQEYYNVTHSLKKFADVLSKVIFQSGFFDHTTLPDGLKRIFGEIGEILSLASPTTADVAKGWTLLGLAYLQCYVPSRPFDPLMKQFLSSDFEFFMYQDISNKIRNLELAGSSFTEECVTFRSSQLKAKLGNGSHLEQPSRDVLTIRSNSANFQNLYGDFNHILRLSSTFIERITAQKSLGDTVTLQSLRQIRGRLENNYRGFDDIVQPLIGFLGFLVIGLSLEKSSSSMYSVNSNESNSLMSLTTHPQPLSATVTVTPTPMLILELEYKVLKRMIVNELDPSTIVETDEIIRELYGRWKSHIEKAQKENESKSSLYTFHGQKNEDDEEVIAEQLGELFPNSETANEAQSSTIADGMDRIRHLAISLSSIHDLLFQQYESNPNRTGRIHHKIRDLIRNGERQPLNISLTNSLPIIFLHIDEQLDALDSSPIATQYYSFYTDSNPNEAKKMMSLTSSIRSRFRVLQKAWPEHATISDVLRVCTEIFDFRKGEPVAKFLTKCEKLHEAVYQWQKVASREYSTSEIYDQLTSLLVEWRRLELSTWSRLLSFEMQKCLDDAKSWWFIAYESIIHVPEKISASGELSMLHVGSMVETIQDFIESTSVGQYAARLDLLRSFVVDVLRRQQNHHVFFSLHVALFNLITHYDRYRSAIDKFVSKERSKLEKDIKEVVQLASWKDVNIDALKQSAKASHQKLFKVIRKFRKMLQQPASMVIEQGLPEVVTEIDEFDIISSQIFSTTLFDTATTELCSRIFRDWASINARFRNVQVTVRMMKSISTGSDDLCDGAANIGHFLTQLELSTTSLRKETPATLTVENKDLVKHLKVRKRTVFADTLKELRRMGFQYNLASMVLAKQDSTAKLLQKSASFNLQSQSKHVPLSDSYFHRIIDLMPRIRAISREHSADLTPAEVSRSIGYLEGLLQCICNQRNILAQALSHFEQMTDVLGSLTKICNSKDQNIQKMTAKFRCDFLSHIKIIANLAPMCLVFVDVISAKSRLGRDHAPILSALKDWSKVFNDSEESMNQMKDFPPYLTTSIHHQTLHDSRKLLAKFKSELMQWTIDDSTIKPILDQLLNFTILAPDNEITESKGNLISSAELRQEAFVCVDLVLAKVQELESKQTELSTISSEDTAAWFNKEDSVRSSAIKALRIDIVASRLNHCLTNLGHLPEDMLSDSILILRHIQPIFQQYSFIVQDELNAYARLHCATCKLSYRLSSSFEKLGKEGFCTPAESTSGADSGAEKLEDGTGLGDGEGAENISKDIGDDEDLTELAEQQNDMPDRDDLGSEEDAVDMADADLEGQMDDVSEKEEGQDDENENDEEDDAEEEVGDVDDLGPSAVDEKMWDSGERAEKDKQGDDLKGSKSEEQAAGADDQAQQQDDTSEHEAPPDEPEGVGQEQLEMIDPHMKESENLELPDDMNLDKQSQAGSMESLPDDVFDDAEDMEEEEQDQNNKGEHEDAMSVDSTNNDDGDMEGLERPEDQDIEPSEASLGEDHRPDLEQNPEDQLDESHENHDEKNPPLPSNDDGLTANDAMEIEHSTGGLDANEEVSEQKGVGTTSNTDQGQGQAANTTATNSAAMDEEEDQSNDKNGFGFSEKSSEPAQSEYFKKLGNVLEKWYNQNRPIQNSTDDSPAEDIAPEVDMADVDFEHVSTENDEGHTQALGAATHEQAKGIDFDETEHQDSNHEPKSFEEGASRQANEQELKNDEETHETHPQDAGQQGSFMNQRQSGKDTADIMNDPTAKLDVESDEDSIDLSKISISGYDHSSQSLIEDSKALWIKHESSTRLLAAILAEQLRLILAPTLATKLRGDFRTGKRLNIKRIIPYIASSYKRDKIWMRRSVPSKRNYQIMIALDDSQSMADDRDTAESTKVDLAYQTLALIAKALSILEAGDLCVVNFGEDLKVAHPFGKPFSDDSGVQVFQAFEFKQEKTDVKKLVRRATEMFKNTRRLSHGSAADLWQLLLVVSDGICEDHESVARLVRQAQEERIMIVFVIVDKTSTSSKVESIMDLQTAEFLPNDTGEMKLVRKKYMDTFPFKWWLVVRDVKELPLVLSTALRQWFSEVVETVR
jgi:midasin